MKRHIGFALALLAITVLCGCGAREAFYSNAGGTYYRDKSGENHVGFLTLESGLYYFQDDGRMIKDGLAVIDGEYYYFVGGMAQTGWQTLSHETGTEKYYFNSDGKALRGKFLINGEEYAFDTGTAVLLSKSELASPTPTPTPVTTPTPPVSETPTDSPTPTPPTTTPTPTKTDSGSAAVGELTGNEKLDKEVKKIIDQVCDPKKDAAYNTGKLFDWMVKELKYKYVTVDLSEGYTDALVHDLAEYLIINRRGSCEHQAALMSVFITRLGYNSQVVAGEFLSDDGSEWVEHAWVIAEIDEEYYHFDVLFGRNHTTKPRSMCMVKDADIETRHRWVREDYPVCD